MNQLAHINLPFTHILKLWICKTTSSKVFTGRKAMIALNEQISKFPNHYSTNVVKGFYHRLRCRIDVLTQPNDYNDAIKFMTLGINQMEKAVEQNLSDPFLTILYKESLKGLATFVDTYHDYSLALKYYPNYIKNSNNSQMFDNVIWGYERMANIKVLTGKYNEAMDDLYKAEGLAKRENLDYSWLNLNLNISEIYTLQGQDEITLELLDELENKLIEFDSHKDKLMLTAKFHKVKGLAYYANGKKEKSLDEYKSAINKYNEMLAKVSSSFTKWIINGRIMDMMTKKMLVYIDLKNYSKAQGILSDIEIMINNESRIYFEYSISIPYEIAKYYKLTDNMQKYDEYLNIAYNEYKRVETLLSEEDMIFFNNIPLHKNINIEKRNI